MLQYIENKLAEVGTHEEYILLRSIRSMILDLRLRKAGLDMTESVEFLQYVLVTEIGNAIERGYLGREAMQLFAQEKSRVETVTPELLASLDARDMSRSEDDEDEWV